MKHLILTILLAFSLSAIAAETDSIRAPRLPERIAPGYRFRHLIARPVAPDSADVARLSHKAFWRAAAETAGMNMGLWAFDRYVQKGHFAYISWSTIKENFRHGFEWDDDHLSTNMFAHPYNGSIFYNAGRSNGFNFWQSGLFAVGGSAMWEMFMEREYPSTNDIIATPIGGAAIGEVLYRTSDVILDDRATGAERLGREAAAFIINPMRGFTRIITGRAWQHRATTGRRFGTPPVSIDFSLGFRLLSHWEHAAGTHAGVAGEINIEYGDKFADETNAPYDYFSFLMEIQSVKTQPLLSRVEIIGRLLSRDIVYKKRFKASVGMYQHFDYFDSDTIKRSKLNENPLSPCVVPYKLGTPASVGIGAMAQYVPTRDCVIDCYAHLNGVLLAGILTDFYRDYHRNYNWGAGFSVKMGINASLLRNKLIIDIANQFYRLYTWQGYDTNYYLGTRGAIAPSDVQGDASSAKFNHFEVSLRYRLKGRLYLAAGIDFYQRITKYDRPARVTDTSYTSNPIIESKQIGAHLMLSYSL